MSLQTVGLWIPLAADGVTQVQHPPELVRALNRAMSLRPGVGRPGTSSGTTNTGHFAATVVPGAMQLTLASGYCFAQGQENSLQSAGHYFAYSEASETISWPAAGGSNRMDSLLLQWADPQYGSIGGNPLGASWRAVAGSSASARPDTDFKSGGSQYVPGAWIRMYDILVPASATQLTQGNVAFKAGYASVLGLAPFFSAARPNGSYYGELGWELDTGRSFIWNGSAWVWPSSRGVVGGTRYTGTGNLAATISTEAVTNMQTGTVAMEANRTFRLKVKVKVTYVSGSVTFLVFRLRDGSLVGTEVAEWVVDAANSIAGHTFSFEADYETTSAVSKNFVLTLASSGATSTINGPGTTSPSYVEIQDIGPSGIITVQATP
jgi:hypothetical protein